MRAKDLRIPDEDGIEEEVENPSDDNPNGNDEDEE